MAVSTKVGAFLSGTGAIGTTVVVSGLGFAPKAVILWWSGALTAGDTSGNLSHQRGMGFFTGATDRRSVSSQSESASAAADCDSYHRNDACIATLTIAGAIAGLMDVQSMDAGGFTLVVDDVFPASIRVHYLAIGGADITNAATGQFQEPGATGNQAITTPGFQPDVVFFMSSMNATAPPSIAVDSTFMFGVGVDATHEFVHAGGSDNGQAVMVTSGYQIGSECIALFDALVTSMTGRAQFVSQDATGFTVNWVERASTRYIHYLAIKGGTWITGDLLTRNDANDIVETGFGFSPRGAMFANNPNGLSTADVDFQNDQTIIGAFSGIADRGAQFVLDAHGQAASVTQAGAHHSCIWWNGSVTVGARMDIKSVDADGFTTVMDVNDPVPGRTIFYVAFGDDVASGLAVTHADAGVGTETHVVTADVPFANTGAGTEVVVVTGAPVLTDTGAGSESVLVNIPQPTADAGAGSEAVVVTGAPSAADSGVGTEATSVTAAVTMTESGAGTESVAVTSPIDFADAGTGTEVVVVTGSPTLADTGTGAEAVLVTAAVTLANTGVGTESISVTLPRTMDDAGTGTEAITISPVAVPITNSGVGTEAVVVSAAVTVANTGVGTESISVSKAFFLSNTGVGSESIIVTARPTPSDSGFGTESISVVYPASPVFTDSGVGSESITISVVGILQPNEIGGHYDYHVPHLPAFTRRPERPFGHGMPKPAEVLEDRFVWGDDRGKGTESMVVSAIVAMYDSGRGWEFGQPPWHNVSDLGRGREFASVEKFEDPDSELRTIITLAKAGAITEGELNVLLLDHASRGTKAE